MLKAEQDTRQILKGGQFSHDLKDSVNLSIERLFKLSVVEAIYLAVFIAPDHNIYNN